MSEHVKALPAQGTTNESAAAGISWRDFLELTKIKIENKEIENIFLDGFNSNKEAFLKFIGDSYQNMTTLNSFDKSIKQALLQKNGELDNISFDSMIDELNDNTNT
jgi:hypothetical protein